MKIRLLKLITIIFIILIYNHSYSQEIDKYGFEYKIMKNEKILLPTWGNILNTITMPSNIFKELMIEYGYNIDEKSNEYRYIKKIENTIISIKQIKKGIVFHWTSIELKTSNIENKFVNYLKESKQDSKTYIIEKENNNFTIKVENKEINGGVLLVKIN